VHTAQNRTSFCAEFRTVQFKNRGMAAEHCTVQELCHVSKTIESATLKPGLILEQI
jgi:hypothetical protein